MKVSKSYLSALFVLLFFAGILLAQQPGRMGQHGERGGDSGFQKQNLMLNLPGLTDEQKDKMKEVRLNGMKAMQPVRNLLGEKMAKLRTLETAEKADLGAINNLIDEISSLRTAQAKMHAGNKQKMRSILNEEQRLVFDSRRHGQGRKGFNGCGEGSKGCDGDRGFHHKRWMETN